MVRIVKAAADRQDEILDAAQALFLQLGYDATSIQAIIDRVGIAKGTFYHHYPSKPALLDAMVARATRQAMAVVEPLVDDPAVPAIDKLNGVFQRIGAWKAERREVLTEMHRALHADANLPLRLRMEKDAIAALVPMVARIVRQGVAEGSLSTRYPDHTARIVLDLSVTLGHSLGDGLLAGTPPGAASVAEAVGAFHEAVERVLGARPGSVVLVDAALVVGWFAEVELRRAE